MGYAPRLVLAAAILVTSLIVVCSRDLRRRSMIEQVGDGCRIGKTEHYVCCFECEGCEGLGVTNVPSCRGRRLVDYWDTKTRRQEDYWETRGLGDQKHEDEERGLDDAEDYWRAIRELGESPDYWKERRGLGCRVKTDEGIHGCCVKRNGCSCPKDVVSRCT